MRPTGDSYIEESALHLSRAISVRFKNDPFEHIRTYMLVSLNEETGEATMRQFLPDEPPDQEQFELWSGSRSAALRHRFEEVALQMALTNDLRQRISRVRHSHSNCCNISDLMSTLQRCDRQRHCSTSNCRLSMTSTRRFS
jgi:hypothetical protein